jgi:phosphoglycolate phosphatase-like HAD superfamily hydrolase
MPHAAPATALAIELDGVLGDTRALWSDWLEDAGRVLGIDGRALPEDRGEAAAELDRSGVGNWRTLLERFAEDRAPVYFRRDAETSATLRRLSGDGVALGVFTDAPVELADVALAQLGATRRLAARETGPQALERLLATLGEGATVVRTREELRRAAS